MGERANILVVEVGPDEYDTVAPHLLQALFDVDRIPSAPAALELLNAVPFSVVIARHPFQSMTTADFISALKHTDSASKEAGIALVTDSERVSEAGAFLDHGVDLVLSLDDPQGEREAMLCTLLGIQPRRSLRVLVKLGVEIETGTTERFVSQTRDISASGLFVITRKVIPVGTGVRFSFTLPGDRFPFEGHGTVTRVSGYESPGPDGLGIHFESFQKPGDERRLQEKLKSFAC